MDIYISTVRRTLDPNTFSDITTLPYTSVKDENDEWKLSFSGDLTSTQVTAIQNRCSLSVGEETQQKQITAALSDLRTIRDSTGTLTGAQLSNSVRVIARCLVYAIKRSLNDYSPGDQTHPRLA